MPVSQRVRASRYEGKILWPATEPLKWWEASSLAKGTDIVLFDVHTAIVKADPPRYFEPDEDFFPLFSGEVR